MVHVVDASAEDPEQQIAAVNRVLREIVPGEKPTLMVFNKIDLVDRELFRNRWTRAYPAAVFVAGREPDGAAELRETVTTLLLGQELVRTVRLPITNLHAISAFHRTGAVLEQTFAADTCDATLRLTEQELGRLLNREGAVLVEPDDGS